MMLWFKCDYCGSIYPESRIHGWRPQCDSCGASASQHITIAPSEKDGAAAILKLLSAFSRHQGIISRISL